MTCDSLLKRNATIVVDKIAPMASVTRNKEDI